MLRRCMVRMTEQLAREPAHAAPTKRLTKLGPDDDVEAYLEIFDGSAGPTGGQRTSGATYWRPSCPGTLNAPTGTSAWPRRRTTPH